MVTDTSEAGLEKLICTALTGHACDPKQPGGVAETLESSNGAGWVGGNWNDYDREHCVDLVQLTAYLRDTQPELAESLALDEDKPTRRQFLARLQGEINKRGTIDVLRDGIKHGPHNIDMFYGTPSKGNQKAKALYEANRFSVTRQLRYSQDKTQLALDLGLFINGLPVATFELKNSLTKQTVEDAVWQYRKDRNPNEGLFKFGRCLAHFAVDDHEVKFCTELKGKASWFLPFNLGWNDGAGNPPNPNGLKTDYLWKKVLTRQSLTNIIENYAQIVESKNDKTKGKKKDQIWPRYHQLDVVRKLLANAEVNGVGKRYLIQHSAGSGKSNSIAWLAHQLIRLTKDEKSVFDSIIVVTDRRILDKQIDDTIRQFAQIGATVGHADKSGDLRKFIESGKKIIVTTLQKFPHILDEIGNEHGSRNFAIIIDEAHSSQGGRTAAAMSEALSSKGEELDEYETFEDEINRLIESRKLLSNASYFAFTATPKNKTLEIFGDPLSQPDGTVKHLPFHSYTMKQAIQEGFILDVLQHYTPVQSFYKLTKTAEDDPEFDANRAQKKLRSFVEGHEHAIKLKAEIMVDHFHEQVLTPKKISGQARAMVVTGGVARAIEYYRAIQAYLIQRKSPYRAIVAFSGNRDYNGKMLTEASLNGFPSGQITDKIQQDPYRFLVCADKFQTGYDEPLLHTMYVDKVLSGIRAVQTLSRLNRAHPSKYDVFVLDFMNGIGTIELAFADYYRTTILAKETDPNKLHDLQADLDNYQVYNPSQIDDLVKLYLGGADRDQLDPILDKCVAFYKDELEEDEQVDFKGKAKAFTRVYSFLSSVLPYNNLDWEKHSIFLNFLVSKLPAPRDEDLSKGILEAIDMDSYRTEKQATLAISLPDVDAEIGPIPGTGGGGQSELEMDLLSNILTTFNELFGNIDWTDKDRVMRIIMEEIPTLVAADPSFQNAKQNSDKQNARIEHDKVLGQIMIGMMKDDNDLFKKYVNDADFSRWLKDTVFDLNYSGVE